ncbi:Pol I core factor CF [Actinomortierella wolfii]|nr:Pol I core factor CF [Actinomortierella wolfii]
MGFPPELEQVAYEFWTLYLTHYTHVPRPLLRRLRRTEKKQISTGEVAMVRKDEEAEDMERQEVSREHDKEQPNNDADSEDSLSSESSDSDLDNSYSSSDSSDDEVIQTDALSDGDDEQGKDVQKSKEQQSIHEATGQPVPGTDTPTKRSRTGPTYLQKLRVEYTLALCYLSCHYLRQPVVFADFYKWVATGDLPLYQASRFVPPKMLARFSSDLHYVFLPRKQRSPNRLAKTVQTLSLFFEQQFKIVQPVPNIPPLTFRFVQEMMLPIEIYPCTLRLCHIFFDMRSNNAMYDLATYGALYVMGVVVMMAKLFIGLDGRTRLESNALDVMNTFPKEKDWLRLMDVRHNLRLKHETPLFAGEFENYRDVNPEGYKEMASRWVARDPSIKENYSNLLKILHRATRAITEPKLPQDTMCPELQAFLRRLFSTVEPPPSSIACATPSSFTPAITKPGTRAMQGNRQPRPLHPGENFVHYTRQSIYAHDHGAFLGNYERVLGYAANTVGIGREEMHKATATVEVSLFKWWAKICST